MDLHQRLALFFERLRALPAFASRDEALAAISRVLTEIEDAYSGVPRDSSETPAATKGRMSPPHPKYAADSGIEGVSLYRQTGHRTYIGVNGAILIVNRRTEAIEFEKPGANGERIKR